MPLPRRSTLARAAGTTRKKTTKKKAPTSRAKRGELLLATCGPAMPDYIVRDVAEGLIMSTLEHNGRTLQIVDTRIDGKKVYGRYQELYEAAPFMFVPVE